MDEDNKSILILTVAGLLALSMAAAKGCHSDRVQVEAIKAGLVQDEDGHWVQPESNSVPHHRSSDGP